jgi:hypothetical protein
VGFSVVPPAYPTGVLTTPLTTPNLESGPQNQPRANVAVSIKLGTTKSIGGFCISFFICSSTLLLIVYKIFPFRMLNSIFRVFDDFEKLRV